MPALEPPRAFLNVSDTATLLLLAASVNRQMLTEVLNPFCHACVKGAFDCSALVFYKSPGVGGWVRPSVVLTHKEVWMGRRVIKKEKAKKLCLRSRDQPRKTSWITFQAQQEVNSILSRGTQEINRHHQHIPTLAQAFQHTGRNLGIMLQWGIDSPFGLMLAGEVSVTVPFWTVFKSTNVCGGLFV